MTTRAEWVRSASPQLIADLRLYPTGQGGKTLVAEPGWGCPCCYPKTPTVYYDGWPLLQEPLSPGGHRRVGFVFSVGEEAADIFRRAGMFYLWEGRIVGEAVVVAQE